MAHNFIRDSLARDLQRPLATAGYILPTAKLQTEKPYIIASDKGARPLDVSFDLDPTITAEAACCPYSTCGGDVTIVRPVPPSDLSSSEDVIDTVTAAAEQHLQKWGERKKLMRVATDDPFTHSKIPGDQLIGEILQANTILIPWAFDPHGNMGPMLQTFLFGHQARSKISFPDSRPNAALMYERATNFPCPLGIVPTAAAMWKRNGHTKFYGHSHTCPTPKEFILQKIGLAVTKAYGMHLRNASRKFGDRPPKSTPRAPPGFDTAPIDDSEVDLDSHPFSDASL